jgi:hypothetical protein
MNRDRLLGGGLIVLGLVGYLAGVRIAYPGRAFSLTALMVGVTLVAISPRATTEGEA